MDKVAEVAPEAHSLAEEVTLGTLVDERTVVSILTVALQVELAVVLTPFSN